MLADVHPDSALARSEITLIAMILVNQSLLNGFFGPYRNMLQSRNLFQSR